MSTSPIQLYNSDKKVRTLKKNKLQFHEKIRTPNLFLSIFISSFQLSHADHKIKLKHKKIESLM